MSETVDADEVAVDVDGSGTKVDVETYNRAASLAELRQIILAESYFKVRPQSIPRLQDDFGSLPALYSSDVCWVSFDADDGIMSGCIKWNCEIKDGRSKALKFVAEYILLYDGLVGQNEDVVKAYLGKVGKFTTYPYFRAAFSLNVASTGLTIPPLPSLRERID